MRVLILFFVLVASAEVGHRPLLASETSPAIVVGAELIYVRRGPGTEFSAFATVQNGERMEVARLDGVWAQVRLASGQIGYVHSQFLSFAGQPTAVIIAPATAPPSATGTRTPSPTPEQTKTFAASGPTETATPTVAAAPAFTPEPPPFAPAPGGDTLAGPQSDVQRLTAAVEALNRHLDAVPNAVNGVPQAGETTWSSTAVGLFILMALLVGWVAGGSTGRQNDRSRRGRIRF